MLSYFKVSGFKQFRDAFHIDFKAVRDYQFNESCIENQCIKNMIVYGKNSVGKSNFGLALLDITNHLNDNTNDTQLYDFYVNIDCEHANFFYRFEFGEDVLEYCYTKTAAKELVMEQLSVNGAVFLTYDYKTKNGNFEGVQKIAPSLNYTFTMDGSILRYVLNNIPFSEENPIYKFKKYVASMLWFRSLHENVHVGYTAQSDDYYQFLLGDKRKNIDEFEQLLKHSGIAAKLSARTDLDGKKRLYFKKDENFLPFFTVASSGTKALYTFFYWYKTAKDASLIYIDEFDAYYHHELSEQVVEILKKMKNTQTIVTTHNTNLLSNKIMRPDCYFILTDDRLVPVADATARELREGHNLEKLYLAGEFHE